MTSILVTGATGYLGSQLIRRLVSETDYEVSVLVRPQSDLARLGSARSRVRVYGCVPTGEGLTSVLAEVRPKVVVHLASYFLSQHAPEDVGPLIDSNVRFGACLLEAMRLTGVARFLNTGTAWETMDGPPDYRPVCLYAATKRAFEDLLRFYEDAHGLRSLTLKLYDTYGPDDWRPKLFSLLRQSVSASEPIAFSPGEQTLDLTHIDDVTEAYLAGLRYLEGDELPAHEEVCIGSGHAVRLKDVAAAFEAAGGVRVRIAWGARPYREREVMAAKADLRRAEVVLGWRPRIDLVEGLRKSFFWEAAYD